MDTICAYLKFDHQKCDELFDAVETAVSQRDWKAANEYFRPYDSMMRQHIRMEEKILIPAFLQAIPESHELIAILSTEHVQIQALIDRMWNAIRRFDAIDYALHAETLTLLLQHHALKEEDMLYPLLDRALGSNGTRIVRAMAECRQPT